MASKKNTPFTDPYGLLKQELETAEKKPRSMLDDLGDIFSGINATRLMTEQDRELNDLAWKYNYDDSLDDALRESLRNDYINKYNSMYENVVKADEAKKALLNSGTTLGNLGSHALSAGSSLESMQEQYKYNLLGALAGGAVGAITGGGIGAIPGAIAGWKMANVPSSLLVNYRDAEAGAYDAWNEVMEKTGDKDLAKQAFYEALEPNLAYAGAAAIPDIIIGGNVGNVLGKGGQLLNKSSRFAKAMERAQASKLGRGISGIANSPIGTGVRKVADKIDDIDFGEGVGAWVANKTGLPMAGKAARAGAQVLLEDLSEVGQETEQGIATNIAVDKALNPNAEGWTLNRFGDWVNSKQGQETMLDTLVATTLTAGLGAGVGSSFSRLRDGYNNKYNLQRTDYITRELGEGGLLSNPEYRENLDTLKEVVAPLYNRDANTITDDEAVRLNLEDMSERMQQQGMTEEEASTYAFNNLVNRIAGLTGRMDYTSDISEQIMKKSGITNTQGLINKETRQRNESEALLKAKTQSGEQVQAKEVHTGTFNDDTTSFTDKVNEAKNDGVETPTQVEKNRQTGTFGDLVSKRIGNYWVRRDNPTIADGSAELDDNTLIYENTLTNKVLQLKRLNNDKISVTDITPDNVKDANGNAVESGSGQGRLNIPKKPKATFTVTQNGLGNVIKYMTLNEKTTTRMMETDEQQESAPLDPNRRQWSGNSARDLADFYRNNKDLMDADTYMLTALALMNYGNKNITLNLDLENQNPNGLGDATSVVKNGVAGAIINLYKGANVVTVLHEFAHVGYDMMSEHEQQLYNRMAQATEEQYIVDTLQRVLPEIYGGIDKKELTGLVRNAIATKTGTEWKAINDIGMLRQTVSMLDQSASEEDKQEAFEERFAWDFSLWYMEGYTKGKKPANRMESMLQRICHKLRRELRLIGSVAQRLQSDGWQNVSYKSMQTMFENMDTRNRQPDANDYTFTSPFDTTRYAIPQTMFGANPLNETQTMPSTAYIPNFTTDGQTYSGNQLAGVTPFNDDNVDIAANMLYDRYKGNPREMLLVLQNRMNESTSRQEIEFLQKVGQQVIQKELAARGETVNDRGVFYAGQREEEVAEPTPAEGLSQKRSYRRSVTWGTARDLFNRMMNGDKEAEEEFRKLPFDQQRSVASNYTMNQSRLENMSFGMPQAIEEGGRNIAADRIERSNNEREGKINEVLRKLRSKSPQGLNIFLKNKAFKNNPIYIEAKKRFDEEQQRQQEVAQQERVQEEQQPEVQNEVQQQEQIEEQVQPASQTVQTEEAQPVVESKEETTEQIEEPEAEVKEETTNGKTEDSGRVEDIRGTEGEVQTGRDSGISTNQRPVLRPELRDKLEGTETGYGEDVSLLRDKNDKPIGRKIPNINDKDSKTMQSLVEKAYGGNAPTDLSGWKQITKSKNKNGDNAITVYNKLFGTDLKEENYSEGDIYIYEDGSAGYAVDNNGFCTVQVSGKKKGLLANAILVARNTKGVRYICANTDGFTTASICSRLGFEPSCVLRVNGEERIVMRKVDMSEEDIIKGINAKSKPVIETKNLPIFYSQESLEKYDSVVENSADKKQLTREDTTRTLDRVRRAVELFPSTSDDELQYLADTIDDTLSKKNSTSKTSSENLYLMNVLSDAAKEELDNRSGKAETDSEGEIVNKENSVLESIYGAQELADERKKSKADTHTADELLSTALEPWRKREDKELNDIKTEADEELVTKKKDTDTAKEDLSGILDKLEKGLEERDEQVNYAKRVLEAEGFQEVNVEDFDVDEELEGLDQKQLENRMNKSKKEREAEKKEVKSEADEETQAMEEAYDEIPEQAKPQNIHIQNTKVKQLNRYDTEDDWHRVCMSTITSDLGRNAGIKEKEDVSPSYVRNFLNGLKGKYEEYSATTLEEGILGTDIDEEDKKEIGRIYRKLSRQKALMDERFSKCLYGDWTDKTGDVFHIRTHAINYYKRLNKFLLGRVKMIMRNNGIHAFEYGFDEKDTKKKLTPKKLTELRKTAGVIQTEIDKLKEQRDSLKGLKETGKQRRKLTRQISLYEDALNEIKTTVWANGQDMRGLTGKNKFSEEYAEVNRNARRAEELRQERENKPAKSVDKDLENSRRKSTVRAAQKRAEERASKSTSTLDSKIATDSSMQGSVVNWNKTVDKHGKTVAPILLGELKRAEDLMKLKPTQELADMSREGQDVLGTFKKLNTLINAAVKHVQITKEQGQEWKQRIKDYTKALNDELAKPKQQPAKPNKTESKPKSTAKVTTEKQQKSSATLDAKQFDNLVKGLFSQLDKNKEALRNTSVQKIVEGIQKGGVVLTPKQVKSIENRLSMRLVRLQLKDNKTETTTKQNKQAQKEKQNNNNKTKEADARETAVRKVKGAVYGNGLGNIHQLHQELAVAKRSPKGVLEKFIGELKKDYVLFYSIAKTLGSEALEKSIDDSIDRVIKTDVRGLPHELDFNNKEELLKYFKEFSKYKSLKEFYKNEYNFDKDKFKAAAKKAAKEVDINNIPILRTANMTNSSVYNVLDTFSRKKTPEEVEKIVAEAKAKLNKNKSTTNYAQNKKSISEKKTPTQNKTEKKENKFEHVILSEYITGLGYRFTYDDYSTKIVNLKTYDEYKEMQKKIKELLDKEREKSKIERKKNMPEDRWSQYRDKDGTINSDSEGVYKEVGETIDDPIFDIYDDPDSIVDGQDYIENLDSYDPSNKLLANLKARIKRYLNNKNAVGDMEYWDSAFEAIEEIQTDRKENDGVIHTDENGCPWTSLMIMDNMIDHAKYLQESNGTTEEKNKPNKSTKTRHMEADTIPETPVEENRDVHSITFTKDALKTSKVNRDRAKELEDNDKYWVKNENEDGSITFTRKSIQPWHTKEITYSGMNGRQVQKKKYEKLSDAAAWFKDKMTEWWFNDKDALKKIADMVGAPLEWMKFVVTKDIGSVASAAIERGIVKHNSKTHERTAALKDIVNAIPKDKQTKFLDYCEAYRIVYDLAPRGIEQKMGVDEANDLIQEVESSNYADLFKEQRKNFIEYNKELLHVLVDGDIISEDFYQALVRDHPNFIPLSKDMSDFNDAFDFTRSKKDLINVKNPLHRIGTSLREVKNPFLEMQKRTFDYYQRAADNKAARIFIDQILQKITRNAEGDEVMLNQALIHKLKTQYNKNGTVKDISDDNKGIFYVMKDGKKEFYQLSDASVFKALKSMSPELMDSFDRFVSYVLSRPAAFVRFFATITPDFGLGNLIRDNGEAFLTSRHGFIPLYDSLWGMWQMKNDTEWFREYNSQVGEMGTRMRESDRVAVDTQNLSDRIKDNPVIKPFFTLNEYLEQGTRIAEYKNARMGYKGTLGRLSGERADLSKAKNSKEYAAYRSKDITLDFQLHGSLGKKFNRYVPFFNASMQGLYKVLNFIDEAWNNKEGMRPEFLLKAALISFLAMSAGLHGAGDDDYEEAPEWEKNNYYVLGNGLRIPKDQVLGKLIGNTFEKFGYQLAKGEVKGGELGQKLFESIRDNAIPDNLTPAFINLAIGLMGDYDTFRKKHITPEYLQDKISYLQKDMSTAQFSADMSKALYNAFGIELGAKKIDYAFNNLFSNTMKYWNKLYDMARQGVTGEKQNERVGLNYLDEDSKWSSDWLNTNTGNDVLDNVLDIAKMMVSKKFIQNQTSFKSIENFNEEYHRLKRLSSDPERMTKEEQKLLKNFYEPAVKKIKANQKKLSEINRDESLDRNQKLLKARPIILKNIEIARWANSKKK